MGDNRGGSETPVAVLEEARKRRELRPDPHLTPPQAQAEEPTEDLSGYALGLADSVSGSDDELEPALSPHATAAEHERPPEHAPALPESFEREQPTAEKILHQLQADRDRAQRSPTTTIPVAHREPSDHQRHGAVSTGERGRRDLAPISRRTAAIACTIIAIATVVPIVTIATSSNRPARARRHRPLAAATTTPAADTNPSADLGLRILAAANARARAKEQEHADALRARSRSHRGAHARAHRVSERHPRTTHPAKAQPTATTTTSTPASSEHGTAQPAASTASASSGSTQQSANSTPPASQPAVSQPAGPTGFGHVVGNNCNPQCH